MLDTWPTSHHYNPPRSLSLDNMDASSSINMRFGGHISVVTVSGESLSWQYLGAVIWMYCLPDDVTFGLIILLLDICNGLFFWMYYCNLQSNYKMSRYTIKSVYRKYETESEMLLRQKTFLARGNACPRLQLPLIASMLFFYRLHYRRGLINTVKLWNSEIQTFWIRLHVD